MENLKDVYLDQLKDLCNANKQAAPTVRELAQEAAHGALRQALERGVRGIDDGCERLQALIREHGEESDGVTCKAMQGLVREARAHAIEAEFGSDAARDAMIIAQYQRMAHYAIAGYGTVRAYARQLDLDDAAAQLEEMLGAAYAGDRTMTRLAETKVNEAAA